MRTRLVLQVAFAANLAAVAGCSSGHGVSSSDAAGDAPGTSGGHADAGSAGSSVVDGGAEAIVDVTTDASAIVDVATDASAIASRLVPWQVESEGSPALVMGIFDQKENVHCRFLPDEAGQLRCLPSALATFTETTTFSDAACTKRIYVTDNVVGASWVDRATAVPLLRTACAPHRYGVVTLKALPAPAPHFGGTPCAPLNPAPNPGYGKAEVTVAEVQAPDRWEKGTAFDGPLIAGRMRVKLVEAPDGTRFVDDFVDEHWNKPCHLVANGDAVYCQATAALSVAGRASADCTGPEVWNAHACDAPAFLGDPLQHPFAVGAMWDGPVSRSGKGCTKVSLGSTVDGPEVFFKAGAPVMDAAMASQPWMPTGAGRLRPRGLVDGTGQVVTFPAMLLWSGLSGAVIQGAHARYFDSVTNKNCNPVRTPEGKLRCVPTSVALAQGSFGFADDKCTQPAFFCPGSTETCPGLVAMKASLDANGEVRAESLNTTREVKTLFVPSASTCVASPVTGLGTYALDAEAPWTLFPELGERNRRAPDGL